MTGQHPSEPPLRYKHERKETWDEGRFVDWCAGCGQKRWPCDTAVVLEQLAEAGTQRDRLRAAPSAEFCPASKHHRVRHKRSGGLIGFTDEDERGNVDMIREPDALISDKCSACGFDFTGAALSDPTQEKP